MLEGYLLKYVVLEQSDIDFCPPTIEPEDCAYAKAEFVECYKRIIGDGNVRMEHAHLLLATILNKLKEKGIIKIRQSQLIDDLNLDLTTGTFLVDSKFTEKYELVSIYRWLTYKVALSCEDFFQLIQRSMNSALQSGYVRYSNEIAYRSKDMLSSLKGIQEELPVVQSAAGLYVGNYCMYTWDELIQDRIIQATNTIVIGAISNLAGRLVLPATIVEIADYAFVNCQGLARITLPEGIKTIGHYAFYKCKDLTDINLPDSLTFIGNFAFDGCVKLDELRIPSSVETRGYGVR